MIVRVVKMHFHADKIPAFLENFNSIKSKIRHSKGNTFLQLLQDNSDPNTFFTYSHWESQQDLDHYRKSIFFEEVWTFTKKLFDKKPEAWSCEIVEQCK